MTTHSEHRYSITVHTDDLAILSCLRALADFCQKAGNKWGNTKVYDWVRNNHQVTFHFSDPSYRANFVIEAQRLLPLGSWKEARQSDAYPASRAK